MSDLKMFEVDEHGETHWIVAENESEAWAIWTELTMSDEPQPALDCFTAQPDDKALTVLEVDAPGGDAERTQTIRQWVEEHGKGVLCSTVFL